jgi:hypothetical protein
MGTKNDPGKFDCYINALPDEPMFTLLGRDPEFKSLVTEWANLRQKAINCGARPASDQEMVNEALACAAAGSRWRRANIGKWRKQ